MRPFARFLEKLAKVTPSWIRGRWGQFRRWRLSARRVTLIKLLSVIGYAISFDRYGTITLPARVLIPHGLGGPSAFIGKKFVSIKRLHVRDADSGLSTARARLLEFQPLPTSFIQSALLPDGNERISRLPWLRFFRETHRLCDCPSSGHRPCLIVPFTQGYYHELLEVLPTLVSNRSNWCIRLCLGRETVNSSLFSFFESAVGVAEVRVARQRLLFGHLYKWPSVYPTQKQMSLARGVFEHHMEDRIDGLVLLIKRRPSQNGRNVLNEEELYMELTRRFTNVKEVYCEDLSIEDQVKLFSCADLVVSPHGAGLANLFAASSGCRLIELLPDSDIRWHYFRIAVLLSIRSIHIICKTTSEGLILDPSNLRKALDKIC